MVRLIDLNPEFAKALRDLPLPAIEPAPWVDPPPLREARVALVSTAGVHRVGDRPFDVHARDYRLIPADVRADELTMSHVSVNFERSAFQQDINTVLPLDPLRELAATEVGSIAQWHYSFMGATDPVELRDAAAVVAGQMRDEAVTAVILVPV